MPARKGARMAGVDRRFIVHAEVQNISLAKAGSALTLVVCDNNEKLGELRVGRGSLFWRGSARKRQKRIPWTRFADMLNELAYGRS